MTREQKERDKAIRNYTRVRLESSFYGKQKYDEHELKEIALSTRLLDLVEVPTDGTADQVKLRASIYLQALGFFQERLKSSKDGSPDHTRARELIDATTMKLETLKLSRPDVFGYPPTEEQQGFNSKRVAPPPFRFSREESIAAAKAAQWNSDVIVTINRSEEQDRRERINERDIFFRTIERYRILRQQALYNECVEQAFTILEQGYVALKGAVAFFFSESPKPEHYEEKYFEEKFFELSGVHILNARVYDWVVQRAKPYRDENDYVNSYPFSFETDPTTKDYANWLNQSILVTCHSNAPIAKVSYKFRFVPKSVYASLTFAEPRVANPETTYAGAPSRAPLQANNFDFKIPAEELEKLDSVPYFIPEEVQVQLLGEIKGLPEFFKQQQAEGVIRTREDEINFVRHALSKPEIQRAIQGHYKRRLAENKQGFGVTGFHYVP